MFHGVYGGLSTGQEACALGRRLLDAPWVRQWRLSLAPHDFSGCRSYSAVVCRLFEAWSARENKPRWGDKTPQYVRHIPLLAELFPNARFLHIVRDGRDVALSWLRARFGPQNLYTAALLWRRWVRQGRAQGAGLPGHRYLEIRYENLLAETEAVLRQVTAFLGENFQPAMMKPSRIHSSEGPSVYPRPQWISDQEIVADNTGKWLEAMPAADRVVFESVAGDLLAELGYPVEGHTREIPGREVLFWRMTDQALRIKEGILQPHKWAALPTFLHLSQSRLRAALLPPPPSQRG